ncbi:DUF4252 domain-containing protein [Portibacter marinus]|uniref:DUF4252 domain-containing protein n=1 Tax=Portibacter marinus TaxID=2898660 RepID=UPI001F4504F8|nr:DUF4252 domain-containing protein [Portibacter marinus]
MKNLYILLAFCFIAASTHAQTRSLNRFINHHKTQDHALAINVPGWMLDIVGMSANFISEDDVEAREILKLSDKISRVRLMIIDDGPEVTKKDINQLIKGLQAEQFEELLSVRSEGTQVRLMVREKRNQIRNITAFVNDGGQTVLITLSGRFQLEEIKNLKIWDYEKDDEPLQVL